MPGKDSANVARPKQILTFREAGASKPSPSRQADPGLASSPLTPELTGDLTDSYRKNIGPPGEFPFTRGIYPGMYRDRLWTMRQYAGVSSAAQTNEKFRKLLADGTTGLNVAFDLPTQHGLDSDDPRASGEVGLVGVPINSLHDLDVLFEGIPLDKVSPANAINAPAAVVMAMYVALAEKRGVPLHTLSGSVQNDILKEYLARGTYIFPPAPSMRLATDVIEFCSLNLPRWNPINVCGYHMREAGSTLVQEVAFALADAMAYLDSALGRGLAIDAFAPRFAFNFTAGTNVLEEAAKFRALRRMWARLVRDRYGAREPQSWLFRTGAGSGASQLTLQQPENNVVRVTLQTLGAVLGGVQSMHTAAYDEAVSLPTEESARLALRTQQIVAYEAGVTEPIDPLAGSYYVEALTDEIESKALVTMAEIEGRGGMLLAIESGWPQRQIAQSAWERQQEVERGDRVIVGLNRFSEEPTHLTLAKPNAVTQAEAVLEQLQRLRADRNPTKVSHALDDVRTAAHSAVNLMPALIRAVTAYATLGEICGVLRDAFGEQPPSAGY